MRVLCLLAFLSAALAAQTAAATGAISGTVTDPQGKLVAGAAVTVRTTDFNFTRTAITDAQGRFDVALLPPSAYSVTATAPGLKSARAQSVTLGIASQVRLNLRLALAATTQQVTVNAGAPTREGNTVQPDSDRQNPEVANVVAGLTVTYLPDRDRDFTQLGELAATVEPAAGDALDIAGQRASDSRTAVDGAAFDDPLEGGRRGGDDDGFFFPQTVVREFQVVHSGAGAEVGDTNAGFLNVATKEGSNTTRGEQFWIFRPSALTANDAFGDALDNRQDEFGGSVGGPIVKNKLYYYVGGEQDLLDSPYVSRFQPQAPGTTLPSALAAQPVELLGHDDPTALSLRLDYIASAVNVLNIQTNYNRVRAASLTGGFTDTLAAPSAQDALAGQSQWFRANLTSLPRPGLVNQLLLQWATDRRDLTPLSTAPALVINGVGALGGDPLGLHRFTSNRRELGDDVAISQLGHALHFGADFDYAPATELHEPDLNGQYGYRSLAAWQANQPFRYQQTFLAPGGTLTYNGVVNELGAYATDQWDLSDRLSVTAGLRWNGQWNPQPPAPNPAIPQTTRIPNDLGQWQPRLGLAWNPRRFAVVRLSAGVYDAPTPATYFQQVFVNNGLNTIVADSDYDPSVLARAMAAGTAGLAAVPAGLTTPAALVYGIEPDFRNPRSLQAAATAERQFSPDFDLTAGYQHDSTWALPREVNLNLNPPAFTSAGMPVFPSARPLPAVGQLLVDQSSAHSRYDALLAIARIKLPYNTTLVANYTLARALDDASTDSPFGPVTALDPFDLALERGYANQDVRHSFNLSATNNLPWGLKVNPVFVARSGLPYTPVIGFDTQNDGDDGNDRAIVNGLVANRNSARQPPFYNLDLRFVKDITLKGRGHHLDLFLDVFNVTNASNLNFGPAQLSQFGNAANPVYAAGQPLYAPATSALGGPRQAQFTVRLVGF